MRILHILDHSLPLHSGYVFRTLGILEAQRALGWETLQLTSPRHNACTLLEENIDGWHFYRTAIGSSVFASVPVAREIAEMLATERRVREVIELRRPDVVHAHSPVLNGIPALRAARRFGIPLIYEVRAFWEDAAVDLGRARAGDMRYNATRSMETFLMRRANAVVTICDGTRKELIGRGISAARISVIPNSVDLAQFSNRRAPDAGLAEKLGLENRNVLGFIGSFYHYEGLDLLIEALPAILRTEPQTLLLLVGGGPEECRLREKTHELGVGGAVCFVGRVPHADVGRYYDLVDCFVYPRRSMRLTELTTPLKPLEAMAQGRIVVASDVGGHRELITHGKTGFLFRPDDVDALAAAVLTAIMAADGHEVMRQTARRFVETERSWAKNAAAYGPIYESALHRNAHQTML